ncbi:MAG: efflux RND transporter periplasmic adaptor subunit [Bacteroidota bacterium]
MKTQRWLLIIGGILMLGFLTWTFFGSQSATSSDLFTNPTKGKFQVLVTTTGELRAKNSIEIQGLPPAAMQLGFYRVAISDLIAEGTLVEKGDYVARLDKNDLQSKIQEVSLSLEQARSQYTQAKLDSALELSEKRNNIVNLKFSMEEKSAEMEQSRFEAPSTQRMVKLEYEKADRAYTQATNNYEKQIALSVAKVIEKQSEFDKVQNELNDLKKLEEQFTIMAPANGMVIYKREWNGQKRKVGDMVEPWDPAVATLPDLSTMESVTYVNEIDIQKLTKGQQVSIGLDAMPEKTLSGEVTEVANIGEQRPNSDSKVFEVVVLIKEKDTTLRPAMTTSNEVLINEVEEALYIPLECLHVQDSVNFVFKKQGSKTLKQVVQLGLINENDVQILAGLGIDDRVFLSLPEDTTGLAWIPFDILSDQQAIK